MRYKRWRNLRITEQGQRMDEISVNSIVVGDRFRKDMGDVHALAASISTLGLLEPIVIDSQRKLICGARRLAAVKTLGHESIAVRVIDCDALLAEHDENEIREPFKASERVAIADAIAERLVGRNHRPDKCGNISTVIEEGKTRDLAAAKAGLGSGKTYEAAKRVVEMGTAKLVEAMDAGMVSISRASHLAKLPADEQATIDFTSKAKVALAADNVLRKERRAAAKAGIADLSEPIPKPEIKADTARFYEEGSSLSAWVLAHRANTAIVQIGKADRNAIAAIESIRATLDKQLEAITEGQ